MQPWAPPEERLYPVLDDLLDEWDNANSRSSRAMPQSSTRCGRI
jgi:hypothetical protein